MINTKTGYPDDLTGHGINKLYTNQQIFDELMANLNEYARRTKGIEDIYTFSLNTNTPFIAAPALALRSEAYFYVAIITGKTIFGMDMRNAVEAFNTYRFSPMSGITNWLMPWFAGSSRYFNALPMNASSVPSTTLTAGINASDATIPLTSVTGMVSNFGWVTIGTEVIMYTAISGLNLTGCVRGMQMTTAASHLISAPVTFNNVFLFYRRLAVPILAESDDSISTATQNHVIEVCDEHMQGIIKLTAYNLLIKIDPSRAVPYKVDAEQMYNEYERDIMKGVYDGRQGTEIRLPFITNESGVAFGTNLIY